MSQLFWTPISESDLPELVALAQASLDRDGGLPELADEDYLRALYFQDEGLVGRDALGELMAVVAVGWAPGPRRTATGLVHPEVRGQGIGAEVVAWARERSGGHRVHVVAETMGPETEAVFEEAGLQRTFAETIMRHTLDRIPIARLPEGLVSLPFTEDTEAAFQHAYEQSFGDQPGYDKDNAEAWGAWLRQQQGFLPEESRVLLDETGQVAGFVTISHRWIEEVGVVPTWRGKGLASHLVARSLTAIVKRDEPAAWLAVGVDNPAHALYERLGFRDYGQRARFVEAGPGEPAERDGSAVGDAVLVSAGSDIEEQERQEG